MSIAITDDHRALAGTASDFLTKPLERGRLAEVLRKWCGTPVRRRALIAEDEPATRDLLRRALEQGEQAPEVWLALVQFFSWFALFALFVYTTPAVARIHFGSTAPGSPAY